MIQDKYCADFENSFNVKSLQRNEQTSIVVSIMISKRKIAIATVNK